jgi:hypothetical protein
MHSLHVRALKHRPPKLKCYWLISRLLATANTGTRSFPLACSLLSQEALEAYKRQQQALGREQRARAVAKVAADRESIRAARLGRFLPVQQAANASANSDGRKSSNAARTTKYTALGHTFKGPQPGTPEFIEQQRQRGRELEVRRRSEGFEATERVRQAWADAAPGEHTLTRWLQAHRLEACRRALLAAGYDNLHVIMQLNNLVGRRASICLSVYVPAYVSVSVSVSVSLSVHVSVHVTVCQCVLRAHTLCACQHCLYCLRTSL